MAIFILLAAGALALALRVGFENAKAMLAGVAVLIPVIALLLTAMKRLERLGAVRMCILLTILCLAVKTLWVLLVRVEPAVDYKTFWITAQDLAAGVTPRTAGYVALFPHIFGYSSFLSVFIRLFGEQELLAPIINVVLSTISGILIYRLAHRAAGIRAAVLAYLLWIICPSQTIYNVFVLSEPLYTTGALLFILILSETADRAGNLGTTHTAAAGLCAGILLTGVNMTRPLGIILLLTMLLWLAFLKTPDFLEKPKRRTWLVFSSFTLAAYLLGGAAGDLAFERLIREEPTSTPGYSVCVGFNFESGGLWNMDDSELLNYFVAVPDQDAQWAQEQMLDVALVRIRSEEMNLPRFFVKKIRNFLSDDAAAVYYLSASGETSAILGFICNAFYYALLLLAIAGALIMLKNGDISPVITAIIYFIGLTMGHMLTEVAGRYHYSLIPVLILTGASALAFQRKTAADNSH